MNLSPSFAQEYSALTRAVGVAALADRTIIAVTGSDRAAFLHSFVTNDIQKLPVGGGCEAFVTSSQGKTLGHVLAFCEPDRFVLAAAHGQASVLIAHFERYVITEDVQFADLTRVLCDLLVAGPSAAALLAQLTGQQAPERMLEHASATITGQAAVVRQVEFAGPQSFFVQVARDSAPTVLAALAAGGAVLCGEAAVAAARLEAGVPLFGTDITPDNLPQEISRDRQAISFVKGCYLGQETVARIDAIGHVNRLLVGLRFSGDSIPPAGTAMLAGGQSVGHVTSAAWSPRLAAPLALALVRRAQAKLGTTLNSDYGDATVVRLPLTDAAAPPSAVN